MALTGSPLSEKLFDWSLRSVNALFVMGGILAVMCFIGIHQLSKRGVNDWYLLMCSFISGVIGFTLFIPRNNELSDIRFIIGFLFISVAFPLGRATTLAVYTKILPAKVQGVGQGVMFAVGAFARIVGPFLSVPALNSFRNMTFVFAPLSVTFAICIGITCCFFQSLI